MLDIRPARFADALTLAPSLRFEDARELAATWGVGARVGLLCCLLRSDRAFAICEGERPVALWGVTNSAYQELAVGVPWLLAADRLFRHKRLLVEQSRRWVGSLALEYDVLTNMTDARNQAHLRWLGWCGFRHLRMHDAAGVARVPFSEFYLVNRRRQPDDEALRWALARRVSRAGGRPPDPALLEVVNAAIAGLSGAAGTADVLPTLLGALADGPADGAAGAPWPPRFTRAVARLTVEIAARAGDARRPAGQPALPAAVGEFCRAAREVAQLAVLAPSAEAGVPGLDPAPKPRHPAPRPPKPRHLLDALARGYVQLLTGGDRYSRLHGYRLRAAALGLTEQEVHHPLGVPVEDLGSLVQEHFLAEALRHGGPLTMSGMAARRQARLEVAIDHASAVSAMGRALAPAPRLAGLFDELLDAWMLPRPGAPPGRRITCAGEAVDAAAALADQASRRLLPGLRLGAVVGGYRDRHWLYRLLRAHLLTAATNEVGADVERVLRDEVLGLLLAGRFENALLATAAGSSWERQVAALTARCLDLFGAAVRIDDDLEHLGAMLLPGVRVPVVHALQLPAALAVWQLAGSDALATSAQALNDVVGEDEHETRRRLRPFLRRIGAEVTRLALERLLMEQHDDRASTPRAAREH